MTWHLDLLKEADKELEKLEGSQRLQVQKLLGRVLQNPYSPEKGGYGKPLGNKQGNNLTGFYKIKLKSSGIRVVYQLVETETSLLVIVIGARADESVYHLAKQRIEKYQLSNPPSEQKP